ncbi:hypothetical protein ACQCVP_19220 [Rossellomorea vietnamensis]|uniref:hypothetical protein n=1 Tax=Rossellomorea vietnamensis TaxID=218284 RepID=UPI003CFA2D5E
MISSNESFLKFYNNRALIGRNSWESLQNYNIENAERVKFDCDSCSQAKAALTGMFGEAQYTDTLISPFSYVRQYIRYYHSDLLDDKGNVPNIPAVKKQMMDDNLVREKASNKSVWAYFIKRNNLQVHEEMVEFSHVVYTLSNFNFSSVCRGFNMGRFAKTKDNFLVALYYMYDYYHKKEMGVSNADLRETLSGFLSGIPHLSKDNVISEVQKWLENYSSFAEFVETYYLQDFLGDPDNSNSQPKELWDGIFEGKLEPSKQEFLTSIEFLTNAIKSRGNRMAAVHPRTGDRHCVLLYIYRC